MTLLRDPLVRAFAVKIAAVAAIALALAFLPSPFGLVGAAAVAALTVGYFSATIGYPASQAFAPTVFRASTHDRVVALTFDDGPDPIYTPLILDTLKKHGARATFFLVGSRAAAHPELVRRIQAEGHTIGTHTQNHRMDFHFSGMAAVHREIEDAIAVVTGINGTRPTLFRPPHGVRSPSFARAFLRLGDQKCVTWSVRGFDAHPTSVDAIVTRIGARLEPGAIVALHDGTGLLGSDDRTATVAAVERILEHCRERALRCVGLGELERRGALVPGPGAAEENRFPFKAALPGVLYWPFRALRTVSVVATFGIFWGGAVVFAWLALPLITLWPGTRIEKTRRAQRALRRCFQAFHSIMRVFRLYRRQSLSPTARPAGAPARGPVVLVANHPTLCDVTSIVSLYPDVVCLARSEFADNVFMGRLLRICGFIPTGASMLDEAAERLKMGFDVLVFPEGTRSPLDGGLQPFHRGAFELARRAQVPIVLLKLTCRPGALSKALPVWRHPDRMPVLTIEPLAQIEPETVSDSRALCRAVERRYHQLLDLEADEVIEATGAEQNL